MTAAQRLENLLNGQAVDRPPAPFGSPKTGERRDITNKTLNTLKYHKNLIIGTGILPPGIPTDNILPAKKQIVNFYN